MEKNLGKQKIVIGFNIKKARKRQNYIKNKDQITRFMKGNKLKLKLMRNIEKYNKKSKITKVGDSLKGQVRKQFKLNRSKD